MTIKQIPEKKTLKLGVEHLAFSSLLMNQNIIIFTESEKWERKCKILQFVSMLYL